MNRKNLARYVFLFVFVFWIFSFEYSFAGENPIGWQLTPATGLPAQTQVGNSYAINYLIFNNIPLYIPLHIRKTTVGSSFTINDTCNGKILAPKGQLNSSCTISINYHPIQPGTGSIQIELDYGNNRVPLPALTTSASTTTCQVSGAVTLPLPVQTYIYGDNIVRFDFTNECIATPAILGSAQLTATLNGLPVNSGLTPGSDTCSNTSLAPLASCTIFASIIPQQVGSNLTINASIPYNNATATTSANTVSTIVNANNTTTHMISFVNQCNFPVWFGFANGSSHLDPTPAITPDDYKLNAQVPGAAPFTKDILVANYTNGFLFARTGCSFSSVNGLVCETGSCQTDATGKCLLGNEPSPPYTKFELNLASLPASDGVYDVSIINGFNVPVEIKGRGAPSVDPFSCTAAGGFIQPTGSTLGACSWSFTPPSPPENFYWVTPVVTETACKLTGCPTGEFCGLSFAQNGNSPAPIKRGCGQFIGYWTVNDYCGYSVPAQWGIDNRYLANGCGDTLPGAPGTYGTFNGHPANVADIQQCNITSNNSLASCFTPGAPALCCGCVNWNTSNPANIITAVSTSCVNFNTDWINTFVLPTISWLKSACPTAYSFPFDDPSVSFSCNIPSSFMSYQITLCPGGKTGAPGT